MSDYLSPPSIETRNVMAGLFRVIEQFGMLPSTYQAAFLTIASDPGHTVDVYARRLNVTPAIMSRRLIDLSDQPSRSRKREGHALIESRRDPIDRRLVQIFLTPKGKALATRLERLVARQYMES
jgi:DNA-binding MarR family transcriptional regulator